MAITTDHSEIANWPRGKGSYYAVRYVRKLKCAWEDAESLVAEIFTWPNNVYPYPNARQCWAEDYSIDPLIGEQQDKEPTDSRLAKYEFAIVTVEYGVKGPQGLKYATQHMTRQIANERAGISGLFYRHGGDLRALEGKLPMVNQQVQQLIYTLTYHKKLSVPPAWYNNMGRINAGIFCSFLGDFIWAPETVYYAGPVAEQTIWFDGVSYIQVSLQFIFQPNLDGDGNALGWNAVRWPGSGGYQYVYDEDGNRVNQYLTTAFEF